MEINILRIRQITLLELRGRVDSSNRDQFLNVVEQELAYKDRILIIDLADVTYMSISGLRVLRRIQEELGEVYITEPSKRVEEMLALAGLDKHYRVFESPADAIHQFTSVVNAHTHLELGWMDAYRPGVVGVDFVDWLYDTVGVAIRQLGDERKMLSRKAAEDGVEALIDAGTTTVCDITNTGESIAPLMLSGLRGVVYIEIIGATPQHIAQRFQQVRELVDFWRPKERNNMRLGISLHAPYTVLPQFWEDALAYIRTEELPLNIHVAESKAEHEFFTQGTGALKQRIEEQQNFLSSPGKSPVKFLEDVGALALKPQLIHAVQVDDDDIRRIKENDCTVVHCPRSNIRLRCGRMPLEKFLDAGVKVYLGTDSLGSSPSLNIFDELEVAVALHNGFVSPGAIEKLIHTPLV